MLYSAEFNITIGGGLASKMDSGRVRVTNLGKCSIMLIYIVIWMVSVTNTLGSWFTQSCGIGMRWISERCYVKQQFDYSVVKYVEEHLYH